MSARGVKQTDPIEHGTYAGVQAERRRGLTPCPDCRRARAEYMRSLRIRRGDTASVLVPVKLLSRIAASAEPSLAVQIRSLLPKSVQR